MRSLSRVSEAGAKRTRPQVAVGRYPTRGPKCVKSRDPDGHHDDREEVDANGPRRSMNSESTEPFGDALRELMEARGLSYRALAEATRQLDGKGMTHAHINMLARGHDRPSMRAMELLARALGVEPEYFAEYRLARAMRELDPAEVGLEQALENLNARLVGRRRVAARSRPRPARRARPRPTG
jgi:transcriptional regulator with XRE-family HTH domain